MSDNFRMCWRGELGNVHQAVVLVGLVKIFKISVVGDWNISGHQWKTGIGRQSRKHSDVFFFCIKIVSKIEWRISFINIRRGAVYILKTYLYVAQFFIKRSCKGAIHVEISGIEPGSIKFTLKIGIPFPVPCFVPVLTMQHNIEKILFALIKETGKIFQT